MPGAYPVAVVIIPSVSADLLATAERVQCRLYFIVGYPWLALCLDHAVVYSAKS